MFLQYYSTKRRNKSNDEADPEFEIKKAWNNRKFSLQSQRFWPKNKHWKRFEVWKNFFQIFPKSFSSSFSEFSE